MVERETGREGEEDRERGRVKARRERRNDGEGRERERDCKSIVPYRILLYFLFVGLKNALRFSDGKSKISCNWKLLWRPHSRLYPFKYCLDISYHISSSSIL